MYRTFVKNCSFRKDSPHESAVAHFDQRDADENPKEFANAGVDACENADARRGKSEETHRQRKSTLAGS